MGEAWDVLVKCVNVLNPASDTDHRPETLAVGGNQYRYIQGQDQVNREAFLGLDYKNWPVTTHQFWSDAGGLTGTIKDAPYEVLKNSWNTTSDLIALALRSHHRQRPIYPSLLMEPDGILTHQFTEWSEDVFGDEAPGGTASRYIEGDPVIAWHMATAPLRDIAQAEFRAQYLRTLVRYPKKLVVEFDWNL